MEPLERCLKAIRGEVPDRPPVVPTIDLSYAARRAGIKVSDAFLDPKLHADSLVHALELHEIDGVYINLTLTPSVIRQVTITADGYLVETDGEVTWAVPYDDVGTVSGHGITSFDYPRLAKADPLSPGPLDVLRHIPDELKRRYLICAGVTGPFSQLVFLMGLDRVLYAMVDEPDNLKKALELRVQNAIKWSRTSVQLGAPCIWIGEGPASGSVISPRQYEEFVLPYARTVVEEIRSLDVPVIMHVCGDINRSIKQVSMTKADVLDVDHQVDLEFAGQQVGEVACIKGNLDTSELLVRGSKQDVFDESTKSLHKVLGKRSGSGFILSSGCCVGRDTPPENVDAMVEAAKRFCMR